MYFDCVLPCMQEGLRELHFDRCPDRDRRDDDASAVAVCVQVGRERGREGGREGGKEARGGVVRKDLGASLPIDHRRSLPPFLPLSLPPSFAIELRLLPCTPNSSTPLP